MLIAVAPALAQIQSGKLTALAVSGLQRHALLPQVQTLAETYKGFEAGAWFGLFAPKGTPAAVVQAIAQDTDKALKDPELRKSLQQQGITPVGEGQQVFAKQIKTEDARGPAGAQHRPERRVNISSHEKRPSGRFLLL